ncbi:MAG: GDSL-type esterase/lipase family protein [Kiritimatiellae bacterium]|nr:GDSL-type esterase/lipase family protein [Kiritimatiellia bacterium]
MTSPLKIVAFGDSMTQAARVVPEKRWTFLLEQQLNSDLAPRKVIVINAGIGGNTSREGLARMDKDVLEHRPDWVLVQFGGNDATIDPQRHVAIEEFNRNLETIWKKASSMGAQVAFISFPPVVDVWHAWSTDEKAKQQFHAAGGGDAAIHIYRQAAERMATSHQCLFIDWYHEVRLAMEKDGYEIYILADGVHFTEAGNRIAFESVRRQLVSAWFSRIT